MIGRKPEPVPGVEPGRWRVVRVRGVEGSAMDWYVDRENCHGSMSFPTWREAMEYADRMARTRDYVLPRSVGSGGRVLGAPKFRIGVAYSAGEKTIWVEEQSNSAIDIRLDELLPLALVLLALAEQEGTREHG